MKRSEVAQSIGMFSRRSVIGTFGAVMAIANFSPWAISPSRTEQNQGAMKMNHYAMSLKTVSDVVNGGGLLVVAQWEAKEGQADKVAAILDRFLPEAQSDPGAKLFLIGRGKDNPAQFLFYELFRDEAALKAHQESGYFKTYVAEQALPLLAKREPTNDEMPRGSTAGHFDHNRSDRRKPMPNGSCCGGSLHSSRALEIPRTNQPSTNDPRTDWIFA